jgi:signal transduction histidine kinase
VLDNLKKMEMVKKLDRDLRIISPYMDEHGVHRYSIVYDFSTKRLRRMISGLYSFSLSISILAILTACAAGAVFANRITSHLTDLSEAAKTIAAGDFTRIVDLGTDDEFGDLAKVFNYMTDQVRRNNRELKNLVRELESRDEQKAQFLANLSHELRTPLTVSLGYVDYLDKGKMGTLNEDQLKSLAIIKRNLERLSREIRSLLEISKHALEGIKIKRRSLRFDELVESVLCDFEPDTRSKSIAVRRDLVAKEVYADPDQLRTVFENLLSNAVKFSDEGSEVRIASVLYSEDTTEYFRFSISSRGAEIPRRKLDKIFEPFYQVDATTKRKHRGIGLGLSIARSIIEAHGGRIWAQSEKGVTVFSFILPLGDKHEKT